MHPCEELTPYWIELNPYILIESFLGILYEISLLLRPADTGLFFCFYQLNVNVFSGLPKYSLATSSHDCNTRTTIFL